MESLLSLPDNVSLGSSPSVVVSCGSETVEVVARLGIGISIVRVGGRDVVEATKGEYMECKDMPPFVDLEVDLRRVGQQ